MQIPQGMAYALLARLPAVFGEMIVRINMKNSIGKTTLCFRLVYFVFSVFNLSVFRHVKTSIHGFVFTVCLVILSISSLNSICKGSIAVISLMTGNVIDRMASTNSLADSLSFANNITNSTENVDQISAITIGTTLAFTVGLVQVRRRFEEN